MKATRNVRGRVRTQWMALGGALVVLAGVVVAWALSSAADRVQVVQVAQEVAAGDVLTADDLTVTGIAFDQQVEGLVPAASLDAVVGRVAAIDLQPGVLLQVGLWRDAASLAVGERSVGVVLPPGRLPEALAQGDTAVAAALDPADPLLPTTVRVLAAVLTSDGSTSLTLGVPEAEAVAVARLGASDQLVLIGERPVDGGRS